MKTIEQSGMRVHPIADIFPPLADAEYRELSQDIAEKGLLDDIVVYEGQILDGRHRYRSCIENGIEPRFRNYRGDDPVGHVLSRNLHRRHLTAGQRALIAAELADEKPGRARSGAQNCALTHDQAAKLCNISSRQVDKASILLNAVTRGRATEQLLESVRSSRLSLNRAEKIARLPKNQQLEVLVGGSSVDSRARRQASGPVPERTGRTDTQAELLAAAVARAARRALKAGKNSPKFWDSLANLCKSASSVFAETAQRLASTSVAPTYTSIDMPVEEL